MNDRPVIPLTAPKRKAGDVHAWLKQQIMLSRVLPGQPLVELEIAATMGCSQGTVREAMLRLQEDGLIVRKGYGGTIVTPVSAVEAKAFLSLRAHLESQALSHSLPRIGREQIDLLSALVREMEGCRRGGRRVRLVRTGPAVPRHAVPLGRDAVAGAGADPLFALQPPQQDRARRGAAQPDGDRPPPLAHRRGARIGPAGRGRARAAAPHRERGRRRRGAGRRPAAHGTAPGQAVAAGATRRRRLARHHDAAARRRAAPVRGHQPALEPPR